MKLRMVMIKKVSMFYIFCQAFDKVNKKEMLELLIKFNLFEMDIRIIQKVELQKTACI